MIDLNQKDDCINWSIAWIELLVSILLMDECLHWNWIKREELCRIREYMPLFLKRFKTVLNRKKGATMKILKFHLFTHVAHKQAGQWTARNARYFEQDVAFQFHHQQVKAAKEIVVRNELLSHPKPIVDLDQVETTLQKLWQNVNGQGCFLHDKTNAEPTPSTWAEDELTESVVSFLQQEVINELGLEQIDLYACANIVLLSEDKYSFESKPFVATIWEHPPRLSPWILHFSLGVPESKRRGKNIVVSLSGFL
jgi:hypothetical protein